MCGRLFDQRGSYDTLQWLDVSSGIFSANNYIIKKDYYVYFFSDKKVYPDPLETVYGKHKFRPPYDYPFANNNLLYLLFFNLI